MQTTKSINLAGQGFVINEDAYEQFNNYLIDIRSRLTNEDVNEVMNDIESRLRELFQQYLFAQKKTIVDMDIVDSVKDQMGSAETFGETRHPFANISKRVKKPSSVGRVLEITGKVTLMGCGALVLIPIVFIVAIVLFAIVVETITAPLDMLDVATVELSGRQITLFIILAIIILGVPLLMIIYSIIQYMKAHQLPKGRFWLITASTWVVAIIIAIIMVIHIPSMMANTSSTTDVPIEVVTTEAFQGIKLSHAIEATIVIDSVYRVELKSNQQDGYKVYVENDILVITPSEDAYKRDLRGEAEIHTPQCTSMDISGACYVHTDTLLVQPSFDLVVSGASKAIIKGTIMGSTQMKLSGASYVDLSGTFHTLDVKVSGACKGNLEGTVQTFNAEVSGASKLDASDLVAEDCHIVVSGASKGEVNAIKTLSMQASGASAIKYQGSAHIEKQMVVGNSSIKKD